MESLNTIPVQNIIQVVATGDFVDINSRKIPYRVSFEMPYCIEEWIMSNIRNRYILDAIKNGKEYTKQNKQIENEKYKDIEFVRTVSIESIKDTGKKPSFYGKSIFSFTYGEIRDFATAFGLHSIENQGTLQELQKQALISFLKIIKNISEEDIKKFSFYKYDKKRKKYFIDFSEEDKANATITEYVTADTREFYEQDNEVQDKRKLKDIMSFNNASVKEEQEWSENRRKEEVSDEEVPVEEDKSITIL